MLEPEQKIAPARNTKHEIVTRSGISGIWEWWKNWLLGAYTEPRCVHAQVWGLAVNPPAWQRWAVHPMPITAYIVGFMDAFDHRCFVARAS